MKTYSFQTVKKMKIKELETTVRNLKAAYYDGNPLVDDNTYDLIEDELRTRKPDSRALSVDSPVAKKEKVELPFFMGSQTKIKTADEVEAFSVAHPAPYILSDKLDGVSIEICNLDGVTRGYTRGQDGVWGLEITHLLKSLRCPKLKTGRAIRAEMIMPKKLFETHWSKEVLGSEGFENARNLVAGATNAHRKEHSPCLEHIEIVAYEVLAPRMKTSKQFEALKEWGFKTAHTKSVKSLPYDKLTDYLFDRKKKSEYEIDGIIVTADKKFPLNEEGNPDWSRAFKSHDPDAIKIATVVDVEWNISKHGYLKPRIMVEPLRLGGVTVTWFTGHNAKYIVDNKIGKGAKLQVIRSGDVIPYIMDIVKPGKVKLPKMDFKWNETGVDIVTASVTDDQKIKKISDFFSQLGVEGFKIGMATRLYDGGLTSIQMILKAEVKDLLAIEGFQAKSAKTLISNIKQITEQAQDLATLMSASGLFGRSFAYKKAAKLVEALPHIMDKEVTVAEICSVDGFEEKTAIPVIKGLPRFKKFLVNTGIQWYIDDEEIEIIGSALEGEYVTFTGFRDAEAEIKVAAQGGTMVPFGSKTTLLVYADGKNNKKTDSFQGQLLTRTNLNILLEI